ncbi:MAG: DNA double-strand break repair nuclease NurA [Candidatus Nanohaloarchaea archaeon]
MPGIRDAAEKLSQSQEEMEELAAKFEEIDSIETDATVKESFLSRGIEETGAQVVAGIDGGLVKKRYSAGDVISVRAVAAVFDFTGDAVKADYLPEKSPEPEFFVSANNDARSLDQEADTRRLAEEVGVALEALAAAETVLMDGSIVPSYSLSGETLESYSRLFEEACDGRLAGIVEDSYGLKLSDMLEKRLGVNIGDVRDTRLMDAILEPGERSFVRRYSTSPVEHPVLQELEDRHVNRLHTFYVKLSSTDLPLRVDYYGDAGAADEIAGKLLRLKASERYTVPSPVVEADKRAKIPETYIKRLEKRFSPGVRRRDRRPF